MGVEFGKAQKAFLVGEGACDRERVSLHRLAEDDRIGRELGKIAREGKGKIRAVAVERGECLRERGGAYRRGADIAR